jgi:hypothetical protein
VPAVHDELLQALGCSSKAVLLRAAATAPMPHGSIPDRYTAKPARLGIHESALYNRLLTKRESLIHAKVDVFKTGQASQSGLQWSAAAEQKVHLLLSSVLLLNAAETPSSGADAADYFIRCFIAGDCGRQALDVWLALEGLQTNTAQHLLEKFNNIFAQSQAGATTGSSSVQTQQQNPAEPSACAQADLELSGAVSKLQAIAAQVEEAVYLGPRYILPTLLGLCHGDVGYPYPSLSSGSCSTSLASGSNSTSSSGGGSTHSSTSRPQVRQTKFSRSPQDIFEDVFNYISTLSQWPFNLGKHSMLTLVQARTIIGLCTPGEAERALAASTAALDALDAADVAWSADAAQLCRSVEGYMRLQAARPSGGSMRMAQSDVALLCGSLFVQSPTAGLWHRGGLLQAALVAGPGSLQQAQLFGLLTSLLKYTSQLPQQYGTQLIDAVLAAALAAASILQDTLRADLRNQTQQQQQQQQQSTAEAASSLSGGDAAGSANTTLNQHSAAARVTWLVLIGRCCCSWAAQQLQSGTFGQHTEGPKSPYAHFMG